MSPACDFSVVKDIVAAARPRNLARGITGALLFDGERFCQLIEGTEAEVLSLMRSISRDTRHTEVTVVCADHVLSERVTTRWAIGYCEPFELQVFAGDAGLRGRAALDAFASILAGADTD